MIGDFESRADAARRVKVVDTRARQTLAALAPLTFDVASTENEIDSALRLRCRAVVERGWASAADYPDGRERDEHDDNAIHLLCRDGDVVAGCLRVVLPRLGLLLPAEQHFGVRVSAREDTVEAGRMVVHPDYRGIPGHPIMAGLFSRGWLELRSRGFSRAVAVAPKRIIELFRHTGLIVNVLGEAKDYWGELRAPIEVAGAGGIFAEAIESAPGEPNSDTPSATQPRAVLS